MGKALAVAMVLLLSSGARGQVSIGGAQSLHNSLARGLPGWGTPTLLSLTMQAPARGILVDWRSWREA